MTKTILITGTSSGFGRETAERLARDGYRVFAAMRDIASRNRNHADHHQRDDLRRAPRPRAAAQAREEDDRREAAREVDFRFESGLPLEVRGVDGVPPVVGRAVGHVLEEAGRFLQPLEQFVILGV